MNTSYLNNLIEYIDKNCIELSACNGICENCPKKAICKKDFKEGIVSSILDLNPDNSRFPTLLKCLKKVGFIFHLIPEPIYEKQYGFYTDSLPCPFDSSKIVDNTDKISAVYNLLSDDESKKTYANLLMYRMTFNKEYVKPIICKNKQYFIESFSNLGNSEVVVDCGAFTGDTLTDYLSVNNPPHKYFLYEPDKNNYDKIKNTIGKFSEKTEFIISDKGLYKSNTTLWFVNGKGTGSYTSESPIPNASEIHVVSIDEDISCDVTFIKMDIEGFERFALEGSRNHILKSYPRLAVCIYHSVDDFINIPLMIKETFPEYNNFFVRHHTDNFRETVLYVYKD